MSTPKRIQRKRTRSWSTPVDAEGRKAVYVGRGSKWGNPFRIYHGHTTVGPMWHVAVSTWKRIPADECIYGYVTGSTPLGPEAVVELYRDMLAVRRRNDPEQFREWLVPLAGRDLMCWCAEDAPCHGDVLLDLANGGDGRD